MDSLPLAAIVVSFLVSFAIGLKWRRWLLLIPLFLLGGAIGFGFGLLKAVTAPPSAGFIPLEGLIILFLTPICSILALIGGAIGIAVGKRRR